MHPLLCFLILTVLCAIVENILYKQEEHLFWNKDAQQYVLLCVGKAMNFHSRSSKSTSKNRRRSKTTTITITWAIAVHPFMNLFWCSHPVDYHPYSLVHPTIQNFIWNKKKSVDKSALQMQWAPHAHKIYETKTSFWIWSLLRSTHSVALKAIK